MFNDLTNYTCCNGDTCISGRCGEKSCPEFCLCVEAFCCFPSAVATNRFMIQDEMRVENTPCDNFLIGFMLCLNQLACIFRVAAMISQNDDIERAADILDCMADVHLLQRVRLHADPAPGAAEDEEPNARPPTQGVMQPPRRRSSTRCRPARSPRGGTAFPAAALPAAAAPAPTYGCSQPPPPQEERSTGTKPAGDEKFKVKHLS